MRIRISVFIIGMSSVIAQTLIMREGLTLFGGYELASGILLCFWLIWGGIGSIFFKTLRIDSDSSGTVSILLLIQCFCVLFALLFLRYSFRIFSLPYGEVISLKNMLFISGIGLMPLCMVFGALFPAISRIFEPNRVYLFEGIGAFIGGILITFVLINHIPPIGIVFIIITGLLSCSFILREKYVLAVFSFAILILLTQATDIEFALRRVQMGDQRIVELKESRYGMIAVTRTQEQINFYTSGVYDFSYPDPYTTEEAVHYPLLLHNEPRTVLLIGGGVGNCLKQILKHPSVEQVTYVEIDPLLYVLGSKHISEDENYGNRVQIVFGDARFYLKNTRKKFDVVIVNLPDPVNAQLNRFFTQDFFAETHRVLRSKGIFSIRISSPPNIIGVFYGELLHTVQASIARTYDHVIVLPVSKMTYIASDFALGAQNVRRQLTESIESRELDLRYVNSYFFDFELTPEKIGYVQERIDASEATLNTDIKPVCYYYTMVLWGGVVSENIRKVFVRMFHISPWVFFIPLIFVLPFYRRRSIVYLSIIAVGASEISAEVVLIILFQVLFGYLYGWIGGIIAAYMLGLAAGTFLYLKTPFFKRDPVIKLCNVELAMGVYFLCILAVSLLAVPGVNILIPVLIFCGGVIGGLHFPLSVAILSRERAGLIYGVDLIGSAFGALITAIILIPIIGIPFTCLLFVGLNILVGFGLRTIRDK